MGKQQGQEDEYVLGPLVEAEGLNPGAQGRDLLLEDPGGGDLCGAEAGTQGDGGVGDHGLAADLEDGQVGAGVADVGEVISEALAEGGELVVASEVDVAIGGEYAVEEAEVVGDALGQDGIGGCGEVDWAAGGVLLLQILKEFAVIGEMGDVEGDGAGDVAFEGGFALQEPAGKLEEIGGVMASEGQCGINEGIGFDEGSV